MLLRWTELSSPALAEVARRDPVAILPVAAVEQHGPHLPLGTDLFIAEGYLARIAPLVPQALMAVVLPIQAIGKSDEHQSFPGTLTLSPEMALKCWVEIGECLARAGIRRLVLLNTHGGNVPVIDLVARTLRARFAMLVAMCSMHRFGYPNGLFDPFERAHGIHGGDVETSLMLAFRPELVDMAKAENFAPLSIAMEERFRRLRANHPVGFAWMSEDLHPTGAMGDPRPATAEKGEAAAGYGARAFVELLEDVAAFDRSRFRVTDA